MTIDELQSVGVSRMSDDEIQAFITHRGQGVLGLPEADGTPYMIPMSFAFDGEDRLYFTFVLGERSHKEDLSDRADRARFLAYDASSPFIWQSVLLTGEVSSVSGEEWADVSDSLSTPWRPAVLRDADLSRGTKPYQFHIEERVGLKGTGLPPGFERRPDDDEPSDENPTP